MTRSSLTRERILDAAIDLIEREGAEALTMRRLGAELGVQAMSLYHHVASREALLRGVGERLVEPLATVELGPDAASACRSYAVRLREIALARPATFRLVGMAPLDEAALVPVERLLGRLVQAGVTPAAALARYRTVVSYARGYALAEAAGFTVEAATADGRARLGRLDAERFPVLAARTADLASLDAEAGFRIGLDALLLGLAGAR